MKNGILSIAASILVALMHAPAHAGFGNGVAGSPHDFSVEIWNHRGEICRVCHVPHDHGRNQLLWTQGLLWNHALSSATYTMYDAGFSNSRGGSLAGDQDPSPTGSSKLCLGCHDGTVAVDSFDNKAPGLTGTTFMEDISLNLIVPRFSQGAVLDMRGTHPISIAFPTGETGDGKNFTDPTTATWAAGDTVASTLEHGKVQCATCHDVHDQEALPGTRLLRTGQIVAQGGASGLCLTCHVK